MNLYNQGKDISPMSFEDRISKMFAEAHTFDEVSIVERHAVGFFSDARSHAKRALIMVIANERRTELQDYADATAPTIPRARK